MLLFLFWIDSVNENLSRKIFMKDGRHVFKYIITLPEFSFWDYLNVYAKN